MSLQLPQPSAEEIAHSARLIGLIREHIAAAGGMIDFARYMDLVLYAPGLGYYSAGARKFGADGDFVTAPELGFVFARCLARSVAPVLRETGGDVLELGPGSGALAADLLLELERLDALPERYRLLEPSADLRERQRAHLMQHCPHLEKYLEWLDAPPAEPWRGVIVANEVIDALPVRLFSLRESGVFERMVGVGEGENFVWRERAGDAPFVAHVRRAIGNAQDLPLPYLSEVRPILAPWIASVAGNLEQGAALFIDYGYSNARYYSPERSTGTLRCHYRHRAHDDPLTMPGLQDITAWVDFDALADAAVAAGFVADEPISQARFLIEYGLDEVFREAHANCIDETVRYRLAQEVKRLTLPGEMGDTFWVTILRPVPQNQRVLAP